MKKINNKDNRNVLNFYRSIYEAVDKLPIDSQGRLYQAIFDYSFKNSNGCNEKS
jgi:hypothetical protein